MNNWDGSNRKSRLPKNWKSIRKKVLQRDHYECQMINDGRYCFAEANQVDHINPGDDHSLDNLQSLCQKCHANKSTTEGHEALREKRREISSRFRRNEATPFELLMQSKGIDADSS